MNHDRRPAASGPSRPERDARVIVAIDVGTTTAKVGVVGLDGSLRGLGRGGYPLLLDGEAGRAEQDPDAWWSAIVGATGFALAEARASARAAAGPSPQPVAVCVVGQGPTLVATLPDGRPAANAVTWLDRRPTDDVAAVGTALGRFGWTITLLGSTRFLSRTQPEACERAAWFLAAWDHVAYRLCGVAATALADPHDARSADDARGVGLDERAAPPGVRAGTILGGLLGGPAAELGLPAGLPVVAGVNDAIATFAGAGCTAPGQAIDTGGTSGGFGLLTTRPERTPPLWPGTAPIPGLHFVGGAMAGTGKALEWFIEQALGADRSFDDLVAEAAGTPPGAGGLLFLPYLAGERWPLHDPAARGAFVGLTLRHGRGHLVRAVMEAAAYAIRHVAAPALEARLPFSDLRVTGGTAAVPLWNRIKADVMGVEVLVPDVTEASLIGAAILGAVGVGAYTDVPAAIEAMVRIAERLAPDPASASVHDEAFAIYEGLGLQLAGLNRALGTLERD